MTDTSKPTISNLLTSSECETLSEYAQEQIDHYEDWAENEEDEELKAQWKQLAEDWRGIYSKI